MKFACASDVQREGKRQWELNFRKASVRNTYFKCTASIQLKGKVGTAANLFIQTKMRRYYALRKGIQTQQGTQVR